MLPDVFGISRLVYYDNTKKDSWLTNPQRGFRKALAVSFGGEPERSINERTGLFWIVYMSCRGGLQAAIAIRVSAAKPKRINRCRSLILNILASQRRSPENPFLLLHSGHSLRGDEIHHSITDSLTGIVEVTSLSQSLI